MSLQFQCPNCQARFEINSANAGRRARCKRCQAILQIPGERAGADAGFRMRPDGRPSVPQPAPASRSAPPGNWLDAVAVSQVALAPVSVPRMPAVNRKAIAPLDGPDSSGTYDLRSKPSLPALRPAGKATRPAGFLTRLYRGQLGGLQSFLRWLNESAYLVSMPFIVLLLFGVLFHNKPLALLGATAVVLLNLTRLVTGLGNLLVIPFKQNPVLGILCLFPPFTVLYCAMHWKRVHKPVSRIVDPLITLTIVALAFVFVPWLRGAAADRPGSLPSRVAQKATAVESEIRQGLNELSAKTSGKARSAGSNSEPESSSPTQPGPNPP